MSCRFKTHRSSLVRASCVCSHATPCREAASSGSPATAVGCPCYSCSLTVLQLISARATAVLCPCWRSCCLCVVNAINQGCRASTRAVAATPLSERDPWFDIDRRHLEGWQDGRAQVGRGVMGCFGRASRLWSECG